MSWLSFSATTFRDKLQTTAPFPPHNQDQESGLPVSAAQGATAAEEAPPQGPAAAAPSFQTAPRPSPPPRVVAPPPALPHGLNPPRGNGRGARPTANRLGAAASTPAPAASPHPAAPPPVPAPLTLHPPPVR